MSGSKAGIRYAKAILQKANEAGNAAAVFEDMQVIFNTCLQTKSLELFYKAPLLKVKIKNKRFKKSLAHNLKPVSYTHLTLPTTSRV